MKIKFVLSYFELTNKNFNFLIYQLNSNFKFTNKISTNYYVNEKMKIEIIRIS